MMQEVGIEDGESGLSRGSRKAQTDAARKLSGGGDAAAPGQHLRPRISPRARPLRTAGVPPLACGIALHRRRGPRPGDGAPSGRRPTPTALCWRRCSTGSVAPSAISGFAGPPLRFPIPWVTASAGHDLIVTLGRRFDRRGGPCQAGDRAAGTAPILAARDQAGAPVALGQIAGVPLIGLPGNPVAALVTFVVLARPFRPETSRRSGVRAPAFPCSRRLRLSKEAGSAIRQGRPTARRERSRRS